jgi:hypothetical protein
MVQAHKLNNLPQDQASNASRRNPDDLRSLRSEYDYKNKKDFTEVLGAPSQKNQLNRLRNE